MLDPRIYRAAFVPVALAVIALAFSLGNQQGGLGTTLAPDAFNGDHAFVTLTTLAQQYPNRRPGSPGDDALATTVSQQLGAEGFAVSNDTFSARTADGTRTLETVLGTRLGFSSRRIVVVAHRDALGSPATAELSGTATLLELARVLSGETLNRTIVLASISGSTGAAGAVGLARTLAGPVDAVLVLGDMAGAGTRYPIVVPWSSGKLVSPTMLRNTVAGSVSAQTGLRPGGTSLAAQLAHLAFPLSTTEQAPFGGVGQPAVLLSAAGERVPAADEPILAGRLNAFGRTALQTISALESGGDVSPPSSYVIFDGKVIPEWAIRLLVLTLILPVLAATVDGAARARRRGYQIGRWGPWVLTGAIPFAAAAVLLIGLRLTGLMRIAPPGPVGAGAVALGTSGVEILAATGAVVLLSFALLRPLAIRIAGKRRAAPDPGAAAAVLLVMCAVTLALWWQNPFAAALVIPALHLWMWVVAPDLGLRAPWAVLLLLAGLAAPVLVALYYAGSLGLSPLGLAWSGALMIAGGQLGLLAILEWSVVLGCLASVVAIAIRAARLERPEDAPVTVRGPVTYAGPGSLGGTESALRR